MTSIDSERDKDITSIDDSVMTQTNAPNIRNYCSAEQFKEKKALTIDFENDDNTEALLVSNKVKIRTEMSKSLVAEPVSISWHNIEVAAKPNKRLCAFSRRREEPMIQIIKNGEVKAGQILAIMGSSGAGKTTLLNVLTARNLSNLLVKGVVKLNGNIADVDSITALSAYVQQADLFIATLTVREHLIFQSLVRMDQNINKKTRISRINQVIKELGLSKCADTRIGCRASFKGISGGELKRLAFASEVLTNPSIMFCDEPTSGLDSFMAESVVTVLKSMSAQGRTIICTIHQPSSEVFALFEQLLLMADGRVAYLGNLDKALDYFSSLGLNCPKHYNPADFFIQQLSIIPEKETECKKQINHICDHYSNFYANQVIPKQTDERSDSYETRFSMKSRSRYKANCWKQFNALIWRSFLTAIREPMITNVRIIQTLVIALILGSIYWQQELDQNGVMNLNGALFLLLTNMTFQNAFAVINTFCLELPIFLREHNNGMYRVDAYFSAKMLAELPTFILIPTIFVGVYYFMVGFNSDFRAFLMCVLIAVLVANCASSFGYLMSCVSSSVTMALSLGPPIMIPLLLFGGFFLNNLSVPFYFVWLKYLSWFYYGNEALIINQWQGIQNISCSQKNQMPSNTTAIRCIQNGQMVLKMLNFDENNLVRNLFLLLTLIIVLRFFAYLALVIRSRKR